MDRRPTLSLNEWAVLSLLRERPRHGYDLADELRAGSPVGEVWRVRRPLVYRALERLEALGYAEARRSEAGDAAPPRTVYGTTRRGRAAVDEWLATPVDHVRDVRSELLLKLVFLERGNDGWSALAGAQLEAFAPIFEGLSSPPLGDVIARWRHHSAAAVASFLRDLQS